jgi:chromosome segregation ATPase
MRGNGAPTTGAASKAQRLEAMGVSAIAEGKGMLEKLGRRKQLVDGLLDCLGRLRDHEELAASAERQMTEELRQTRSLNDTLTDQLAVTEEDSSVRLKQVLRDHDAQLAASEERLAQGERANGELVAELEQLRRGRERQIATNATLVEDVARLEDKLAAAEVAAKMEKAGDVGEMATLRRKLAEQAKLIEELEADKAEMGRRFFSMTHQMRNVAGEFMANEGVPKQAGTPARPTFLDTDPVAWKVRDVAAWLATVGLGEYASEFTSSSVDGDMLFELTEEDLEGTLAMGDGAQRRRLLDSIEGLRSASAAAK